MAKLSILAGATSQSINVFIQDSSSTTGAGLTGLVFNTSNLVAYYALPKATAVQITLATLAAITTAYSSGGFKEVDATNMPGWYRLDLPDAAIASGRFVSVHLKGATNMAPCPLEIELTAVNNQSATAFITGVNSLAPPTNWNLTSIDSNGRVDVIKVAGTTQTARDLGASVLLSSGTGTGQLDFTSGVVKSNMTQILGTATSTPATAGILDVNVKNIDNDAASASGTVTFPNATLASTTNITSATGVDITKILGTAISTPATAGILDVNVKNMNNVAGTSITTINANQGTTQPVNYTGTGASALVKSDMVDIAGAAVSTSSAQIGVNAVNIGGTAQTGRDLGASVLISSGTGTGQLDFTSGVVKANLAQILGTALTETAGLLAGGFKKFFNISSPQATMDHGILVDTVTTYTGNTPQTGDNFARLGAPVGASISADIAGVQADTDNIQTRLPAALVSGRMDSSVGAIAVGVDFTAVMKTSLNASTPSVTVSDKTGFSLSAAGVQAIWDALTSALTTVGSIGKRIVDNLNTVTGNIAGAVWDIVLSGHLTAGTTGAALNSASSAGDPWNTALPGAYGAGTAGKILGTNLDATVSSRLATSGYTAPDNVDIVLIKAKTDNLPAAPAAVSDIPTANNNADALLKRDMSAISGEASRSPINAFRAIRNKVSLVGTLMTVTKENDVATAWTATVTTDATAEPITEIDPS